MELPRELWNIILKACESHEIWLFSRVCKYFHSLVNSIHKKDFHLEVENSFAKSAPLHLVDYFINSCKYPVKKRAHTFGYLAIEGDNVDVLDAIWTLRWKRTLLEGEFVRKGWKKAIRCGSLRCLKYLHRMPCHSYTWQDAIHNDVNVACFGWLLESFIDDEYEYIIFCVISHHRYDLLRYILENNIMNNAGFWLSLIITANDECRSIILEYYNFDNMRIDVGEGVPMVENGEIIEIANMLNV